MAPGGQTRTALAGGSVPNDADQRHPRPDDTDLAQTGLPQWAPGPAPERGRASTADDSGAGSPTLGGGPREAMPPDALSETVTAPVLAVELRGDADRGF